MAYTRYEDVACKGVEALWPPRATFPDGRIGWILV